ncbi:MAG: hypothetical protein PUC45_05645 [Oscillospiraceae bacterium]|nr:hypothetical protein [Oscillospiraceae bacterium]
MHIYTAGQWVLLFFFYCFCGWVWESCYVSLRQRRWVNRGFLEGPLLPIYGSGAIIILFVTLPVEGSLCLIWLFGMIAATALEYVTGAVMERLFKVRYWDYSQQRFNLNGHICLSSSIAWGFFSIFLVRVLHPPVGRLLARVPGLLVNPLAAVLAVLFAVDVVRSVRAALDLKTVLIRLTEENEDLRRLARRAEVAAAFAEDDLRRFRERTEVDKLILETYLTSEAEARRVRKLRHRELLEESLRRRVEAKLQALDTIGETLQRCLDHLQDLPGLASDALEERRAELTEALEHIERRKDAIRSRTTGAYHSAARLLRGNPSAAAREFREAMEILRQLDGRRD